MVEPVYGVHTGLEHLALIAEILGLKPVPASA